MSDHLEQLTTELRAFLDGMGATGDDWDQAAGHFGRQFLSLDPATVAFVTREQLRQTLPSRARLFDEVGASGTTLTDVEVTELDDQHVLAETRWRVDLTDAERSPLRLHSSYLLRREEGSWQVLVYLNHQDLTSVMAGS